MANEHPDAEKALYQELANIKELKKEVRSLKKRLDKLTGRIVQLEVKKFQKQLNRLDKRITKISDEVIASKRTIGKNELTLAREVALGNVHHTGHALTSPPTLVLKQQACTSKIEGYWLQGIERMEHCENTKDVNNALLSFVKTTNRVLKDYRFPQIQIES